MPFSLSVQQPVLLWLMLVLTGLQSLAAQDAFDLILLDTKPSAAGLQVVPGSAQQVTNRDGYDNQPFFINNQQLVFTSSAKNGSSDVILYNFETKKFTNMTRTNEVSEYSPALTACGTYISAVRVEQDGKQRLWLYPINFGEPELLYDDISPVGYYGWAGDVAALAVVGNEVNKLVFPYGKADLQPIAFDVGRCIQARPNQRSIGFIDHSQATSTAEGIAYTLKAYDPKTRTIENLGPTLPGSEDFLWLDKNRVIMARGKDLYFRHVRKKEDWQRFAVVSVPGYGSISRMALSPRKDKLILVMDRLK
ncbi:TolB family protein [Lunatimonas salinarum]|uniref:TolB family protein n=1 Tax=Lunatimonas salinarum TaxID=1774590 RepID=UPI001FD776A2|nr:hypothetical protein [Lunatimonas salinarum]